MVGENWEGSGTRIHFNLQVHTTPSPLHTFCNCSILPPLVVRRLIIVVMNRLIRAPRRGHVQVVPQVDVKLLTRAHVPSALVWPVHTRNTPLQIVATKSERSVCVLAFGERDGQRVIVDDACLADDGIEQLGGSARCGNELDELAIDDL